MYDPDYEPVFSDPYQSLPLCHTVWVSNSPFGRTLTEFAHHFCQHNKRTKIPSYTLAFVILERLKHSCRYLVHIFLGLTSIGYYLD